MRQGRSDLNFIVDEKHGFMGVCLGYDFVAEHEWGIAQMRSSLGMENPKYYESFKDLIVPATEFKVRLFELDKYLVLTNFNDRFNNLEDLKNRKWFIERNISEYHVEKHKLATAWDGREFMVAVLKNDEKSVKRLTQLHEAFKTGKAVLSQVNLGIFTGRGLCITILDKIPAEQIASFDKGCKENLELVALVESIGIEQRLKDAGRRYYALSPRKDKDAKSKYSVVFWLNPVEQDRHNHGWFVTEQLDEWIAGKGPIMKLKKKEENGTAGN